MKKLIAIILALALLLSLTVATPVVASTEYHVYYPDNIQEAVDSASSGDVVIVHEGSSPYDQEVVFGLEDGGITLRGEGGPILQKTEGPSMDFVAIAINPGVSGVTIEGFDIRNYRFGVLLEVGANNNVVIGNKVSACYDGINLVNAHDNQVIDNMVTGCIWGGIWLGPEYPSGVVGSDNNLVSGNEVYGGSGELPGEMGGGICIDSSDGNQVIDNVVEGSIGPGVFLGHQANNNVISGNVISGWWGGINLGNAQNNTILGNVISGITENCILLGPEDGTGIGPSNNLVSVNEISGGSGGIVLLEANDNEVIDNVVSFATDTGISVENISNNNTINGNKVSDCGEAGIVCAGTNEVIGNRVYNCSNIGIKIEGSSGSFIELNQVEGGWEGIVLDGGAELNHIDENNVTGCEKSAIAVKGGSNNNFIEGNRISKNGLGILVTGSSHYNSVLENIVKHSTGDGISLRNNAEGNIVKENYVSGSGEFDLHENNAGEGNIWEENKYKTSYPDPLPSQP